TSPRSAGCAAFTSTATTRSRRSPITRSVVSTAATRSRTGATANATVSTTAAARSSGLGCTTPPFMRFPTDRDERRRHVHHVVVGRLVRRWWRCRRGRQRRDGAFGQLLQRPVLLLQVGRVAAGDLPETEVPLAGLIGRHPTGPDRIR